MSEITTKTIIDVPFFDVDSYRIVWHGHYPKYFEIARCQLLEEVGFPYAEMEKAGYFFPIVDLQTRYIKPIRFTQTIVVAANLKAWENKLVIDYLISDNANNEKLTTARSQQVAVKMPEHITLFQSPPELIERVNAALAEQS